MSYHDDLAQQAAAWLASSLTDEGRGRLEPYRHEVEAAIRKALELALGPLCRMLRLDEGANPAQALAALLTRLESLEQAQGERDPSALAIEHVVLALAGATPEASPQSLRVMAAIINLSRAARNWHIAHSLPAHDPNRRAAVDQWTARLLEVVGELRQEAP